MEIHGLALPDIQGQVLEHTIFNTLGRVLTANGEYQYAAQILSQGLDLIKDANADLWAVEMLVSISELLNSMKEKSIAIALVNQLVYHPHGLHRCQSKSGSFA